MIADGQHRAGLDPAAMEECKPSSGELVDKGTVIVMPVGAGVAKLVCGIDRPGVGMDGRMDNERDPTVVALTRLVMEHDPELAVEVARRDGRPPFQRSRINEVLVVAGVATERTPAGVSGPRRIDRTVGSECVLQHGPIGVERCNREPLDLPVVVEGPQSLGLRSKGPGRKGIGLLGAERPALFGERHLRSEA